MKMKWIYLTALLTILSACGTSTDDENDDNNDDGNTTNPPVTTGDWYRPVPGTTWQWQLQVAQGQTLNISYDVEIYDIDLFDTPASLIEQLHADGRKVICYFSAGSWEDFRSDKDDFDSAAIGNELDGWPGEKWLDVRSANVRQIMQTRLDLAASKGCDGVEPDNMDGYTNTPGFDFGAADQLDYNRFIANEAHIRGLSVGLKNDLDQIPQLVEYYDFAVNEQCFEYDECDSISPFIDAGKAVLNAEYAAQYINDSSTLCADSIGRQFSTLVLNLSLDASYRDSCQSQSPVSHQSNPSQQ
jgi:hypothetical protein